MLPAHTTTPPELPDLADFCRKWRISKLELFGSALRESFRPDSDIDLLYTTEPDAHWTLSDYLRIQDDLEQLLGRKVDFVARESVEQSDNWYRKRHILSTAKTLYAA